MSSRPNDGWAGIVDIDDPDAEKTPVDGIHLSEEPTPPPTASAAPARALRLPVPGGSTGPTAPARPAVDDLKLTPPPLAPAKPSAAFAEDFAQKITAPLGGDPKPKASGWREYRELILTAVIGSLLLAASFAWKAFNPSTTDEEAPGPRRAGQVVGHRSAPPEPTPSASRAQATGPTESATPPPPPGSAPPTPPTSAGATPSPSPPKPAKAAIPMLSVVTIPPDAEVEIEGELIGRSPLIVPAKAGIARLKLRVSKDGHAPVEQVLTPNEGGHFNATVTLKPRK